MSSNCTQVTPQCPLDQASLHYRPNVPANVFFAGLFGVAIGLQLFLGAWRKTWTYVIAMTPGLILEIIGYIGRLMLHHNPYNSNAFLLYLVPLTIGPAFFSAAIYLCLGRVITIYGAEISRFKPKTYTYIFVSCDLISLILQAAGGAIASSASDTDTSGKDMGVNIMIAGLSFQVASLFLFGVMASEFFWRLSKSNPAKLENDNYAFLREDWKLTAFVYAMAGAVLTIFIRSIFRVAELQGGFQSALANDEVDLMILESAMISIAVICMTVAHPSICIGRVWRELK